MAGNKYKSVFLITIGQFIAGQLLSQDSISHQQRYYKNYYKYGGLVYVSSMLALNQLWYADYDRTSFQTFNDNNEWLKLDKAGHVYSTYTLSSLSYYFLKGEEEFDAKAARISSASAFLFLSSVELLDGFSERWGFSWGDMISNTLGIGLFYGQEALLHKQVIRLKFSYQPTRYRELRPDLLGDNELQGIIKDYNGQIYWASVNLNAISKRIKPEWLNLAIGYGGKGMISARKNRTDEINGFRHEKQYFMGLDLDLTKIKTNKKWLKTTLELVNYIKIPSPTVEFKQGGDAKFHWLYF